MGMSIEEQVRNIKEQLADVSTKYRMMQSDYNARLKADLVAILTELQLEIEENVLADDPSALLPFLQAKETCVAIIQQRINALTEGTDDR